MTTGALTARPGGPGGLDVPGSASRKAAVRKYFKRTPDPADETRARLFLAAAIVFAIGAASLLIVALPALAAIVGAVAVVLLLQGLEQRYYFRRRFRAAEPKPSDKQMDDLLKDDLSRAAARAMERLALSENELELRSEDVGPPSNGSGWSRLAEQGLGPLVVFGPVLRSRGRIGGDRKWRFMNYEVMAVCPTGHHIAIYKCVLDFATGLRRDEQTHEYFYTDVVAVSTITTPGDVLIELLGSAGYHDVTYARTMKRELQIVISSGDRSTIVVGIRNDDHPDHKIHLQESGIDHVIEALRRKLREKKGRR